MGFADPFFLDFYLNWPFAPLSELALKQMSSLVLLPDTKIFRYLSLEKFLNLVETKDFYLAKLSEWKDPYENKSLIRNHRNASDILTAISDINPFYKEIKSLIQGNIRDHTHDEEVIKLFEMAEKYYSFHQKDIGDFLEVVNEGEKTLINEPHFKEMMEAAVNSPGFMERNKNAWERLTEFERHYLIYPEQNFGSSWTFHPDENKTESDGLWVSYSKGSGVRIETTVGKLDKLISEVEDRSTGTKYITEKTIAKVFYGGDGYIESQIMDDEEIFYLHRPFLQKRTAFSYEEEVRALVSLREGEGCGITDSAKVFSKIDDLAEFIDAVLIDPNSHPEHAKTLEKYCNKHGLKCDASKLYTFDLENNPHKVTNEIKQKFENLLNDLKPQKNNV